MNRCPPRPRTRRTDSVGASSAGRLRTRSALALFGLSALAVPLCACPYSIRDAAFLVRDGSTPFALYLSADAEPNLDPWIAAAAARHFAGSSMVARSFVLGADDERDLPPEAMRAFAVRPAPPAVFVAPNGGALALGIASDRPWRKETVNELIGAAASSPLRTALRASLAEAWCAGVLVPGTDSAANSRARAAFERAAKEFVGHETELGKTVKAPPVLFETTPEEDVVRWSQGLGGERTEPRLVLIVGRGERRGSILEGEEITPPRLTEWFTMLGRSCSCTTDPKWMTGPAIPIVWGPAEEAAVRAELGFDPADPDVLRAVRIAHSEPTTSAPPGLGYEEFDLERFAETHGESLKASNTSAERSLDANEDPERAATVTPAQRRATAPNARFGHRVVLALALAASIVLAAVTALVLGRR